MTKEERNLFTELSEGFEALASERAGKRTLRTHEVSIQPADWNRSKGNRNMNEFSIGQYNG